jgi:hypothetical protein
VTATLVTGLVVSLGVVFSPRSDTEDTVAADLAGAVIGPPRANIANAALVDPPPHSSGPPPWRQEPAVTLEPKPEPKPKPVKKRKKPFRLALPPAAEFVISSFNVLGSSHTSGSGKLPGMASGPTRIRQVVALLRHHGVDVVGLQELQGDQYRELVRVAGGTFAVYPGNAAGPLGIENSLAWNRSEWSLVEAHTIQIPYFDGRLRPMPYVLLRHNATGRYAWFGNFHNPASNARRGNNDRHRARAAALEVALANRLMAETGYPVFITGDMNDREAYFCRMTGGAPMIAANGGSNDGACNPPPYPMPVDWIFGSDIVTFSGYLKDDSRFVRRTSDHPMIVARAVLDLTDGVAKN